MTYIIKLYWVDILNCKPIFAHRESLSINLKDYNVDCVTRVGIEYNHETSVINIFPSRFEYNTKLRLLHIIHNNIGQESRSTLIDFIEVEYMSVSMDRQTKLEKIGI